MQLAKCDLQLADDRVDQSPLDYLVGCGIYAPSTLKTIAEGVKASSEAAASEFVNGTVELQG